MSILAKNRKKSKKWNLIFSFNTLQVIKSMDTDDIDQDAIQDALKIIKKDPYAKETAEIKKSKKNARRIHAGAYRIIYRVNDYKNMVNVIYIALRKDIQYDEFESFQQEIQNKLELLDG